MALLKWRHTILAFLVDTTTQWRHINLKVLLRMLEGKNNQHFLWSSGEEEEVPEQGCIQDTYVSAVCCKVGQDQVGLQDSNCNG
eukprot:6895789-Ditylum_brightwellii.AAC.1